jgi:hypothetical protein
MGLNIDKKERESRPNDAMKEMKTNSTFAMNYKPIS